MCLIWVESFAYGPFVARLLDAGLVWLCEHGGLFTSNLPSNEDHDFRVLLAEGRGLRRCGRGSRVAKECCGRRGEDLWGKGDL